jgi:hypothetical protein
MHTNVVQQIEESKLRSMIVERLQAWQSNNRGALPATILWYRDGVSESQFGTISTAEIPQIRKAYAEAGGNERDLKVTFVVVGKRHHTRFYAAKHAQTYPSKEANRTFDNGNLPPRRRRRHRPEARQLLPAVALRPQRHRPLRALLRAPQRRRHQQLRPTKPDADAVLHLRTLHHGRLVRRASVHCRPAV